LLEQRLVACAAIGGEVESRYRWQGKLETAREVPLTLKALRENWATIEAEIRRLHSYAVPEVLAVAVEAGSAAYLAWLDEVAGKQART
jgi:periplasmic divalent cation tolerance protein